MGGTAKQGAGDEQGIDVTTTVEDHGNRRGQPEHHHAPPGDDAWREDEEGETDTPENTGSKVGTGRDDLQPQRTVPATLAIGRSAPAVVAPSG